MSIRIYALTTASVGWAVKPSRCKVIRPYAAKETLTAKRNQFRALHEYKESRESGLRDRHIIFTLPKNQENAV